jgi:hypothetical protein
LVGGFLLIDLSPDEYTASYNGDGSGTATGTIGTYPGATLVLQVFVSCFNGPGGASGSGGTTQTFRVPNP